MGRKVKEYCNQQRNGGGGVKSFNVGFLDLYSVRYEHKTSKIYMILGASIFMKSLTKLAKVLMARYSNLCSKLK